MDNKFPKQMFKMRPDFYMCGPSVFDEFIHFMHLTTGRPVQRDALHPDYVPSLNMGGVSKPTRKSKDLARYQRAKVRRTEISVEPIDLTSHMEQGGSNAISPTAFARSCPPTYLSCL
jgi:hypothetical protein